MHITEILKERRPSLSFEFFPPKTEKAASDLFGAIRELEKCRPSFVSVTYGAGGSTRTLTHELVLKILQETDIPPVPHLTCVCHREAEIEEILANYAAAGVGTILALRGDPPRDQPDYDRNQDSFPYASDLVRHIREFNASGRHPAGKVIKQTRDNKTLGDDKYGRNETWTKRNIGETKHGRNETWAKRLLLESRNPSQKMRSSKIR